MIIARGPSDDGRSRLYTEKSLASKFPNNHLHCGAPYERRKRAFCRGTFLDRTRRARPKLTLTVGGHTSLMLPHIQQATQQSQFRIDLHQPSTPPSTLGGTRGQGDIKYRWSQRDTPLNETKEEIFLDTTKALFTVYSLIIFREFTRIYMWLSFDVVHRIRWFFLASFYVQKSNSFNSFQPASGYLYYISTCMLFNTIWDGLT